MKQLVYVSTATETLSPRQISEILQTSRENNRRDDITGLLISVEGIFLQVLEGEADAVDRCFVRISQDDRHEGVSVLLDHEVEGRTFGKWAMAYRQPDELDAEAKESVYRLADLHGKLGEKITKDPLVANLIGAMIQTVSLPGLHKPVD